MEKILKEDFWYLIINDIQTQRTIAALECQVADPIWLDLSEGSASSAKGIGCPYLPTYMWVKSFIRYCDEY